MLKVGDPAPDFTLSDHRGGVFVLSAHRGRKVLMWFFPEAGTPGCTAEGRGFRDGADYFNENRIDVVGISFNSVEENAAFARKEGFEFPLLSDVDRSAALAYGACTDRRARYADRVSILVDEHGNIERMYDQVDPRDHPARVLADLLGV
jgi:thioredoxin-dependent peroxiredoxin